MFSLSSLKDIFIQNVNKANKNFFEPLISYAKNWYKNKEIRDEFFKLLLCILCSISLNLSLPFVLKFYLLQPNAEFYIYPPRIILFYCLIFLLSKLITVLERYIADNLITRISYLINLDFIKQVLRLDRNQYGLDDIGGITHSLSKAQTALPTILSSLTIAVIPLIIEFTIFAVIILNLYGIDFFLYFILMINAIFLLSILFSRELNKNLLYSAKLQRKSTGYLVNILYNYETIAYFATQSKEIKKYLKYHSHRAKNDYQYSYWMFINQAIKNIIFSVVFTIIIYYVANSVANGTYQIADLVFINSFVLQLFQPLSGLDSIFRNLNKAIVDFMALLTILISPKRNSGNSILTPILNNTSEPCESHLYPTTYLSNSRILLKIRDDTNSYGIHYKEKLLSFQDVSFSFNNSVNIFENLYFDIVQGEKILLTAPSGSGKSTLIKLIYKLFRVNSGRITITGQDINAMQQSEIASKVGIVPQDIKLFDATILENITYGASEINYNKLEKAMDLAACTSFIKQFPTGYNTLLSSNEIKLSGGQMQRLAIARIFYHDPDLYIFDEALSALDDDCNNIIINSMNTKLKNKAVIFITHTKPNNMTFSKVLTINNKKIRVKN